MHATLFTPEILTKLRKPMKIISVIIAGVWYASPPET